jgi:hypothetical protein
MAAPLGFCDGAMGSRALLEWPLTRAAGGARQYKQAP